MSDTKLVRYDAKSGGSKMKVAATVWGTLQLLGRRRFAGRRPHG